MNKAAAAAAAAAAASSSSSSSSSRAAAEQQQSSTKSSSRATAEQQQSSSRAAATQQQQQPRSSCDGRLSEKLLHVVGKLTVETLPADVAEMIEDARNLQEEHAHHLRTPRHANVEQLLDGKRVAVLRGHHGDIVQAIHVESLLVVLVLNQLLRSAVQQSNVRSARQTVSPVSSSTRRSTPSWLRVLRTKVQCEILDLKLFLRDELALHASRLLRFLHQLKGLRRGTRGGV